MHGHETAGESWAANVARRPVLRLTRNRIVGVAVPVS